MKPHDRTHRMQHGASMSALPPDDDKPKIGLFCVHVVMA
jgi:hypothetical protein